MKNIVTTIDERRRTGALTGMVETGQRYEAVKVSDQEIHLRLLIPAERPRPRLIRREGMTFLTGGPALTAAAVAKALEEFP